MVIGDVRHSGGRLVSRVVGCAVEKSEIYEPLRAFPIGTFRSIDLRRQGRGEGVDNTRKETLRERCRCADEERFISEKDRRLPRTKQKLLSTDKRGR